jgi:hypothetical protein
MGCHDVGVLVWTLRVLLLLKLLLPNIFSMDAKRKMALGRVTSSSSSSQNGNVQRSNL